MAQESFLSATAIILQSHLFFGTLLLRPPLIGNQARVRLLNWFLQSWKFQKFLQELSFLLWLTNITTYFSAEITRIMGSNHALQGLFTNHPDKFLISKFTKLNSSQAQVTPVLEQDKQAPQITVLFSSTVHTPWISLHKFLQFYQVLNWFPLDLQKKWRLRSAGNNNTKTWSKIS